MQNNDYISLLKGIATNLKALGGRCTTVVDGGGLDPIYYTQIFVNQIKGFGEMFMVIQTYDHGFSHNSDNLLKQPICRFMILNKHKAQSEVDMHNVITDCEVVAEKIVAYLYKKFKKKVVGAVADSFLLETVKIEKLILADNKCGVGCTFVLNKAHGSMLVLDTNDWNDLDI